VEALRLLATSNGSGPVVGVEAADALPPLPAAVEVAAYRIAAEALANALRHSNASRCCIMIRTAEADLVIEVDDDGQGFGTDVVTGVGLQSMHQRAAEVGGEVAVTSAAECGTSVRARLPLELR
jgi:signal transduction histidine kinase